MQRNNTLYSRSLILHPSLLPVFLSSVSKSIHMQYVAHSAANSDFMDEHEVTFIYSFMVSYLLIRKCPGPGTFGGKPIDLASMK